MKAHSRHLEDWLLGVEAAERDQLMIRAYQQFIEQLRDERFFAAAREGFERNMAELAIVDAKIEQARADNLPRGPSRRRGLSISCCVSIVGDPIPDTFGVKNKKLAGGACAGLIRHGVYLSMPTKRLG